MDFDGAAEILHDVNFSDDTNWMNCMNNVDIDFGFDSPYKVYDFLRKLISKTKPKMKWIPYSQIENLIKIATEISIQFHLKIL